MEKGKSGMMLGSIAAVTFILAYLNWSIAIILILAFVLLVEKNDWLSTEVINAFYLLVGYSLLSSVLNVGFNLLYSTIGNIQFIYRFLYTIDKLVVSLLNIGMLIVCILAAVKVFKEEKSSIPFIGSLAESSLGIIKDITN